ncbi:MAG: ferritin-like domain-containing protein [Rhizobiaceae bacterium]
MKSQADTLDAKPDSLRGLAIAAISARELDRKTELTRLAHKAWQQRGLSLLSPLDPDLPDRPGRPDKPDLVAPKLVKKRSLNSQRGRIALLHALAHIELNAIDLALDIVARFATVRVPQSFFDGWMQVAFEEAKHFDLLRGRLNSLGAAYGDLPAHDGLWQAATSTSNDLNARLAVVPLVLEARGLDITPSLIEKMLETGDCESADILDIIYTDEKKHVAIGAKWFRFFCARDNLDPAKRFQQLVRTNFRGQLKPPFNERARAAAGLTTVFYRSLSSVSS